MDPDLVSQDFACGKYVESIVCTEASQIFVVKETYPVFVTVTPDILHCSCWGGDCILNDIQLGYKWYLLRIYDIR
jgi:hypothetical protein